MHRDDIDELVQTLSRRGFLLGGATLAFMASLPSALAQKMAPATFAVGDKEVSVFSDGSLVLPLNVLAPSATPEQLADIARRLGWASGNAEPQANIPVIKAGNDLILIDNGSGSKFQPTAGKLLESLKAGGVDPASITKVVFTHAHPDHIWGTLGEGDTLVFPNAAYYVGAAEFDFWMNPDIFNQLPKDFHPFAEGAQRDLGAVKDRITMLKPGDEVVAGIRAIDSAGHTPGHMSIEIEGGDGLIVTGDVMPNEITSLEHPGWAFGFDAIPDLSSKNRVALLERASADKIGLLGYHWTYPGVGKAEKSGSAYKFAAMT